MISYVINDDAPGVQYATVGFVPVVHATLPPTCYHTARAADEASIHVNGIQVGALVGKKIRDRFLYSLFCICVSDSAWWAERWAKKLYGDEPAVMFPVRTDELSFIQDPACPVAFTKSSQ